MQQISVQNMYFEFYFDKSLDFPSERLPVVKRKEKSDALTVSAFQYSLCVQRPLCSGTVSA